MFESLKRTLRNAQKLHETKILISVYKNKEVKQFIIDLNRYDQLFQQGEDIHGDVVGYYSKVTESINPEKIAGDHYNFTDTGKFFRSFSVRINSNGDAIISNDRSVSGFDGSFEIAEIYEDIIGLQTESEEKLIRKILPRIREMVRREILR